MQICKISFCKLLFVLLGLVRFIIYIVVFLHSCIHLKTRSHNPRRCLCLIMRLPRFEETWTEFPLKPLKSLCDFEISVEIDLNLLHLVNGRVNAFWRYKVDQSMSYSDEVCIYISCLSIIGITNQRDVHKADLMCPIHFHVACRLSISESHSKQNLTENNKYFIAFLFTSLWTIKLVVLIKHLV